MEGGEWRVRERREEEGREVQSLKGKSINTA